MEEVAQVKLRWPIFWLTIFIGVPTGIITIIEGLVKGHTPLINVVKNRVWTTLIIEGVLSSAVLIFFIGIIDTKWQKIIEYINSNKEF